MSTCFYVSTASDGVSLFKEICVEASAVRSVTTGDGSTKLSLKSNLDDLATTMDIIWILTTAIFVFWMQTGFALLEAGTVRSKNTNNILFKNLMDICFGAISFWLIGYSFAFGNNRTVEQGSGRDNEFIGSGNWALQNFDDDTQYHLFFFQWVFCSAATTIVSGSVAERCRLEAYFTYSIIVSSFVYPVVVHWIWSPTGFLSPFYDSESGERLLKENGVLDFAGSGVVHMVGGFSGLVGSIVLGPRIGFDKPEGLRENSNDVLCSLGIGILWMGWYGFNAGSTLAAGTNSAINLAAKIATVTTIAASSSALMTAVAVRYLHGHYRLSMILNGVISGLVSITASCAIVEPWAAMMIGFIGSLVYIGASKLLIVLKVDDPLDAFPVHGACGVWGMLATGIFATRSNILRAYGFDNDAMISGNQFRNQLLGVVLIITWTMGIMIPVFFSLHFAGLLRISREAEEKGLDVAEHGVPWLHRKANVEKRKRDKPKKNLRNHRRSKSDFSQVPRAAYPGAIFSAMARKKSNAEASIRSRGHGIYTPTQSLNSKRREISDMDSSGRSSSRRKRNNTIDFSSIQVTSLSRKASEMKSPGTLSLSSFRRKTRAAHQTNDVKKGEIHRIGEDSDVGSGLDSEKSGGSQRMNRPENMLNSQRSDVGSEKSSPEEEKVVTVDIPRLTSVSIQREPSDPRRHLKIKSPQTPSFSRAKSDSPDWNNKPPLNVN
mmetsp:Transcript_196/g.306  ORF Transcript_196/g.306 Transcript_196/m.306 type:complete len:718 (+) Transcript_196:127-2280(+)|eukprot:CAMPEP_0167752710 /NCGR_PEP_ID=MMETSP0110_2-20121227/7292_1 /TAXON_ID=629695 /ORGANISM="Gymnochlora sp., Strain CCMP2014" /LENGTH=717 /DNA_ID=CAMNT_0007638361 /DNA_START=105 /DNA_END=2258 /DNA_ORIENTATION=-